MTHLLTANQNRLMACDYSIGKFRYTVKRLLVNYADLPESPDAFPSETDQVSLAEEEPKRANVWEDVIDANSEILKIAASPKIWNLPIRSLKDIPGE
jgi:hypothetical protein